MRGFRAWHTKLNRYLKDDEFFISADGKVRNDSFGRGNYEEAFDTSDFDSGYIILEQDTGLKDKNGKKIWEGDVVKVEDDEYTADTNKFLGYNATVIRSIYHAGAFAVKNWWGDRILGWDVQLRRIEIIGNVHENPELLEEGE